MPRTRSVATDNLLFALLILFLAVAGCQDPNAIERARQRGEAAGRIDGLRMGEAEGRESTYQPAYASAYKRKITELYNSSSYTRKGIYTVIVLGGSFLLAFSLQYLVLYVLRSNEFLFDIDRIVLPRSNTRVDLVGVLNSQQHDETPVLKQLDTSSSDSTHG